MSFEYDIEAQRFEVVSNFLQKHKVAYSYSHTWKDFWGQETTVSGGPFATEQEALASKLSTLRDLGWERPRWWQFWRWGEAKVVLSTEA